MAFVVGALVGLLVFQMVVAALERGKVRQSGERRDAAFAEERSEWAAERGRLIAAVKNPSFLPTVPVGPAIVREPREPSEAHRVGTINLSSARNGTDE